MAKYIDADALVDRLDAIAYHDWNQGTSVSWADAFKVFADMVRDEKVIDAVEVVRCKDCVYYKAGSCRAKETIVIESEFCSWGKRREHEVN